MGDGEFTILKSGRWKQEKAE